MVESAVDELERRTGLSAEQRRERARRAGLATGRSAQSLSNHVQRVAARARELSADDLALLRSIVVGAAVDS